MIRRLRAALAWLMPAPAPAADAPATPGEAAAPAPSADSRYAAANTRIRDAAKWMAAALGAIATVLVGTSPLSGIGRLSGEDPERLGLAIGAILVGLAAALGAIRLLGTVQLPQTVLATDLIAMAEDSASAVAREAANEPFLTAGHATFEDTVEAYLEVQRAYYAAVARLTAAERAQLMATAADADAARAAVERAKEWLAFEETRSGRLAPAIGYATDLAIHEKLRWRASLAIGWSAVLAVLAGMAFVVFAWAANPPEASAPDVLAARPSAGVLRGDEDDRERLERQVGTACAAQVVDGDGAAVVALGGSDETLDVVIVPDGNCTEPVRLTVAADRVMADDVAGR